MSIYPIIRSSIFISLPNAASTSPLGLFTKHLWGDHCVSVMVTASVTVTVTATVAVRVTVAVTVRATVIVTVGAAVTATVTVTVKATVTLTVISIHV